MVWTTKDGLELEIEDMETSHIINCMNMMERVEFYYYGPSNVWSFDDMWSIEMHYTEVPEYIAFQEELKKRGIS